MKALVLHNIGGVSISVDASSEKLKADLLSECRDYSVIADEFSMNCASDLASRMKSLIADVEDGRKAVKAPVLDLGKRIDSTASEFSTPISTEMNRVLGLIQGYLKKQRQAAEELERMRQEEIRRLELEKAKAEEIVAAPFTVEESKQAQQTIAAVIVAKQAVSVPIQAPIKPKGIVTRSVPKIQVIDLHEVYKHNLDFVRIELNQSAVLAAIRAGKIECPGLRITFEDQVEARR